VALKLTRKQNEKFYSNITKSHFKIYFKSNHFIKVKSTLDSTNCYQRQQLADRESVITNTRDWRLWMIRIFEAKNSFYKNIQYSLYRSSAKPKIIKTIKSLLLDNVERINNHPPEKVCWLFELHLHYWGIKITGEFALLAVKLKGKLLFCVWVGWVTLVHCDDVARFWFESYKAAGAAESTLELNFQGDLLIIEGVDGDGLIKFKHCPLLFTRIRIPACFFIAINHESFTKLAGVAIENWAHFVFDIIKMHKGGHLIWLFTQQANDHSKNYNKRAFNLVRVKFFTKIRASYCGKDQC